MSEVERNGGNTSMFVSSPSTKVSGAGPQGVHGTKAGGDWSLRLVQQTLDGGRGTVGRSGRGPSSARTSALSLMLAKAIPASEVERTRKLFQRLTMEKLMKRLDSDGEAKLELARWKLERIEEADLAPSIEMLGGLVEQYEALGGRINQLLDQVEFSMDSER